MFKDKRISVVIPCLNEEKGLESVLGSMPSFVYEVIVVDNGSVDNSRQIAKKYNMRSLTEEKRGYGSAILKGLENTNGEIVVIIDGDASYPVEALEEMGDYMEKDNLDFVSGCRFPLSDLGATPFIHVFGNYFISWCLRFLFKIKLIDSQTGMMIFKKSILDIIKPQNRNMGFSQEIKIKAWLNPGINCGEIHIPYHPRIGKVKFNKLQDGKKNLTDALFLWVEARRATPRVVTK